MFKPSNSLQRPSPIIVGRQKQQQKNKKMMCFDVELTRQLSKFSNEAYHRDKSASVPFVWESQPGTPKVRSQESSLPPLTPPPSYYQNATKKPTIKAKIKNSPKAGFLQTIFPTKRTTRKGCVPPPPSGPSSFDVSYSSSSSSSSLSLSRPISYSVPSSPMIHSRKGEEDDQDLYEVTSSNMCFGNARSRGCYSYMFKKVLLGDFL